MPNHGFSNGVVPGRRLKQDKANRKRRREYKHHGKPGRPRTYGAGRKVGHHLYKRSSRGGTGRYY